MQTDLTDGWGLTTNGTHLIASDSTNVLTFMKPSVYATVKQIEVTFDGDPVIHLNELEWVDGYILANIYETECIAKIDPATGNIVGWILLNGLAEKTLGKENTDSNKVMNGIAAIPEEEDTIYVTGKHWPPLYKILLKPEVNWDAYGSPSEIKVICMVDPKNARF